MTRELSEIVPFHFYSEILCVRNYLLVSFSMFSLISFFFSTSFSFVSLVFTAVIEDSVAIVE